MRRRIDRLVSRGAAVVVLASALFAFGGACDERTKKDDTRPAAASPDVGGPSPANQAEKEKTFEKKDPVRMGPKAPALMMLAGLKGYTEPCGCTLDVMLGGIDRIVGYTEAARSLYSGVAFVDGGNMLFEYEEYEPVEIPQEKARVAVIVAGMKAAGVEVTVPGKYDLALGSDFYLESLKKAEVDPISVNATINGEALEGVRRLKIADQPVIVVGVNDPKLLDGVEGIAATDPHAALDEALSELPDDATPIVALVQGDLAFVKDILAKHERLDFGLVGWQPRMTDQVDSAGEGHTIEAYDQGRHLGILSFFPDEGDSTYESARTGSQAEIEKIEKRIEHLEKSLDRLPPDKSGNATEMALRLRKQIQDLEERRKKIESSSVEIPEDSSAFVWNSVALEPGYPQAERITKIREEFNKSLEELNKKVEREVVPVEEGEPFYIGSNQCAQCHSEANEFWKETGHGHALATLQERNKAWDQSCIGCHVVGYEKPGGSVLGKLQYDAKLQLTEGSEPITITKDLRNVGCESCHGPGSAHRISPVDSNGNPHNIALGSGTDVCMQCHVPEHSPRFEYDNYVRQITGPGHELKSR